MEKKEFFPIIRFTYTRSSMANRARSHAFGSIDFCRPSVPFRSVQQQIKHHSKCASNCQLPLQFPCRVSGSAPCRPVKITQSRLDSFGSLYRRACNYQKFARCYILSNVIYIVIDLCCTISLTTHTSA